jgi:phenylpyruvate tautomerase PptA (4-oxalocrotonate tautomerase family)
MGVAADSVTVVIHETHQDNWGSAGEQHSEKHKDIIKRMKSRTNINNERENS